MNRRERCRMVRSGRDGERLVALGKQFEVIAAEWPGILDNIARQDPEVAAMIVAVREAGGRPSAEVLDTLDLDRMIAALLGQMTDPAAIDRLSIQAGRPVGGE
ncbi:MAG TPA: hypothetical protein HA263_03055 [Methanoregulaceae archaeon]|nr:hypothetical protein [Methanoregulaceae archaeon]